jgi:hypothetical protein
MRRANLTGPALEQLYRRILFFALITWLPLAVLSLIEGNPSGIKLTFWHDIEAHVRFLIAVPVLIAAELIVQLRMRITIRRFIERGIIRAADIPRFNSGSKLLPDFAMRCLLNLPC